MKPPRGSASPGSSAPHASAPKDTGHRPASAGDGDGRLSRRRFLGLALVGGAALALAVYLPHRSRGPAASHAGASEDGPDLFVHIEPDGAVRIKVVRSEMGQGVRTGLPMIVAEELDADWSSVVVEQGDADPRYSMGTGGSQSVYRSWDLLRRAGATLRAMLVSAAAARWGVDPSLCRTHAGWVLGPGGQRLSYGELSAEAAALDLPRDVVLKDPAAFSLIGTTPPRYDGEDIVRGQAVYGEDIRVEGMRFASLERPPVPGARLRRLDDAAAREVEGVIEVLSLDVGVAVVAETTWAAFRGRRKLKLEWDEGDATWFSTAEYDRRLQDALQKKGKTVREEGDAERVLSSSDLVIEADYSVPFLAHATMLPLNCTARVDGDGAEIWAPTQFPNWARREVLKALKLPEEAVVLHVPLLGSGLGRRIYPDIVLEAVAVARGLPFPVQLVNTRADDFRHGVYRPGNAHRLRAVLDEEGFPRAWSHRIAGPSISASWWRRTPHPEAYEIQGAADLPYAVPHLRVGFEYVPVPVKLGAMRAVARVNNAFVTESFVDELAHAAGRDPLQYRLDLLERARDFEFDGDPIQPERIAAVLRLAAEKAGWGRALPAGRGLGIAVNSYGSCRTITAEVAEVEVDREGRIRVHKVWCAVDCGVVVHPDLVRAQFEGGVVFALTSVLESALSFERGRARETDFRHYPLLTIDKTPEVEVAFVPSGRAPGGIGEPPVPPLAPAVANAVFAATGRRLRSLPLGMA